MEGETFIQGVKSTQDRTKPYFSPALKTEKIDISKTYRIGLVIILLGVGIIQASGQRVIVNSNGEKIIMYPDGSWRMVETGDSLLLRQSIQKSEITSHDGLSIEQDGMPGDADEKSSEMNWNDLHFEIKALEKKVQSDFRAATNAKFRASELLQKALANKENTSPDQLAAVQAEYKLRIRRLKTSKTNLGDIKRLAEMSRQLAGLSADKMKPGLNKLRSKFNNYLAHYNPEKSAPESIAKDREIVSKAGNTEPDDTQTATARKYGGYAAPVAARRSEEYRSVPVICNVLSDTLDEATGRRKIELAPALMFTHTDPDLRPYFKNKELITCYGKLSKIDAYVYLSIEFQIASSHSQSNFGSLQSGSLLRMKLLNGEYVSLYSIRSDRGRIDPYSGYTIFTGQYALGKNEIKQLMSSELDKVRILWTTGYEDYDVYKIDFFRDQLDCLMDR